MSKGSGTIFDLAGKKERIKKLEEQMSAPDFWDDRETAEATGRQLNDLRDVVERFSQVGKMQEELDVLEELMALEEESTLLADYKKQMKSLEDVLSKTELETLFSSPYDALDCIVTLHPGAGGTESQDWTEMLYRMYLRWAESSGFVTEVLDYQNGDEAGIKSVTFGVSGRHAYGYLKAEKGVHRLVRISPFDTASRRHTSFASVDVVPQMPEEEAISIDESDLRIDTYRSGGAGGQHLNKTDSAVRITHLPTGIVVQCQSERSQFSNKAGAMKILQAKLYEEKRKQEEKELAKMRGSKGEIAWGSQIRSYVFHPYKLVKDHRTNIEIGNVDRVMDGDIDPFIEGYLHAMAENPKEEEREQ